MAWTWILIYILNIGFATGCSRLGVFFASILFRVDSSNTRFPGGISFCETSAFKPDGFSCFCDIYIHIYCLLFSHIYFASGLWHGMMGKSKTLTLQAKHHYTLLPNHRWYLPSGLSLSPCKGDWVLYCETLHIGWIFHELKLN